MIFIVEEVISETSGLFVNDPEFIDMLENRLDDLVAGGEIDRYFITGNETMTVGYIDENDDHISVGTWNPDGSMEGDE